MPNINIECRDGRGYNYPILKEKITIGRSKDNDISLKDNTVSRNHAQIIKTKDDYLLTDLGSFNGTMVNKKSIHSAILKHEDQIKMGLTKLTFLTKEKTKPSLVDSLIITPESDHEIGQQHILNTSPYAGHALSQDLLISIEPKEDLKQSSLEVSFEETGYQHSIKANLSSLERSNKVLFILYEISRQLNSIQDFNGLFCP